MLHSSVTFFCHLAKDFGSLALAEYRELAHMFFQLQCTSLFRSLFFKYCYVSGSPGGLVKIQITELYPQVSDTRGLGGGLRICISNEFPGDADSVVWGPPFGNHCFRCTIT